MYPYFALIALDLARERAAEADRHRLAALARRSAPQRVGIVRRFVARAAVAVARAADERLVQGELAVH
jgi:hypothetical protein